MWSRWITSGASSPPFLLQLLIWLDFFIGFLHVPPSFILIVHRILMYSVLDLAASSGDDTQCGIGRGTMW